MLVILLGLVVFLLLSLNIEAFRFDLYYTIVIPILYFIINYQYIKTKKNIINFEFFFCLSFFLSSFLTPIVLPRLDKYASRIFIDSPFVNYKAYIVCMIGYLCYMIGLITTSNREKSYEFDHKISITLVRISNIFCLSFVIVFLLSGGLALLTMYSSGVDNDNRLGSWGVYLSYAMITYTISIFTNLVYIKTENKSFSNLPLIFLINSAVLIIMLAYSGYRSNLIQILLPFIYVYDNYYKKIRKSHIIAILLIGVVFLLYSGFTRQGTDIDIHGLDIVSISRDFRFANAANSYLIYYSDNNGFTYGANWILQILSIVPFLQSLFIFFCGNDFLVMSSSRFFTKEMTSDSGLGTAIIGDIYYSFGLCGVCVLMFFLGFICRKLSKGKSFVCIIMYLVFLGNSIFASRVEFFYIVRMVAFSAIIMIIEYKMSKIKFQI